MSAIHAMMFFVNAIGVLTKTKGMKMTTAMLNVMVETPDENGVDGWSEFWTANLSLELLPQFFEHVAKSQTFFAETDGDPKLRVTMGPANDENPSYTTAQELTEDFDTNW